MGNWLANNFFKAVNARALELSAYVEYKVFLQRIR
jgi:hypothetical protein